MNVRRTIAWLKVRFGGPALRDFGFEIAFLAAFGIMAVALAGIALRGPIDRALFFQDLDFSSLSQVHLDEQSSPDSVPSAESNGAESSSDEPNGAESSGVEPGSIVIPRGGDSYVLGESSPELHEQASLDLSDAPAVPVWRVSSENQVFVSNALSKGAFDPHGVVLDEASAARANVRIGDQFVLAGQSETGGIGGCPVVLTGLSRPYVDYFNNYEGLVLLPQGVCSDIAANGTLPSLVFHSKDSESAVAQADSDSLDHATKSQVVWGAIMRHAILAPGVVTFMGLGIAIWVLALWRVSANDRNRFARTDRTLTRLGVPVAAIRASACAVLIVGALTAAIIATLVAKEVAWKILEMYFQSDLLVGLSLGLTAISLVPIVLTYRFPHKSKAQP